MRLCALLYRLSSMRLISELWFQRRQFIGYSAGFDKIGREGVQALQVWKRFWYAEVGYCGLI